MSAQLVPIRKDNSQIGVAISSMLTLIAYRFMLGNLLPKVAYMTRLNYFILVSTVLVFITLDHDGSGKSQSGVRSK